MDKPNRKARGEAGIPKLPEIRDNESVASIQLKTQRYFIRLRAYWQAQGIEVDTTESEAQLARLAAILRVQGNHGLGSIEGRAAGGMMQLPARIFDLKNRGFEIHRVPETAYGADGLRHVRTVRYFLVREPEAA